MDAVYLPLASTALTVAVSAAVAYFVSRRGGSQKIAELRQKWIDGLRDDLAILISHVRHTPGSLSTSDAEKLTMAHARILLRLNPNEESHMNLGSSLELYLSALMAQDMARLKSATHELFARAQIVLKAEWNVVKRELKG